MEITIRDIEKAERILLPEGLTFDEERRIFIKCLESCDLLAVPGSGKTTALQANFTRNGKTESYPAKVVVTDPQNDLAIIKIDDQTFNGNGAIPYGLMTRTKDTGSEVFSMGYPMADVMGSEIKFTDGKISSKSGIGGDVRVYQISVPIQPGNSGGP